MSTEDAPFSHTQATWAACWRRLRIIKEFIVLCFVDFAYFVIQSTLSKTGPALSVRLREVSVL